MSRWNINKNGRILVLALFGCLVVLLIIAVLLHIDRTSSPESSASTPVVEKKPDTIAIPGYEMLELIADRKEQTLSLPNPDQNMCYFQISLHLEDGTLLWKSELIEPGKTCKPMILTKALGKGTYPNAFLRYSCYRMDEALSPLNGAETKVTLWVK